MPFKSAAARKEYDRKRYLERKAHSIPSNLIHSNPLSNPKRECYTENQRVTAATTTFPNLPENRSSVTTSNRELISAPSFRELPRREDAILENRPISAPPRQLPESPSVLAPITQAARESNPSLFRVLMESLGPLAGIPVAAPPTPAPARHDPPSRPQIAAPAAPRVRPAQQVRQGGGFAPEESFHIQGER